MTSAPIGYMDSGLGGLTVVKQALAQLPNESVVYFGDTARLPYGPRPVAEVREFATEIAQFLVTKGIKLLVIACNTATAAALPTLQAQLDIPVVGVIEPGSQAAVTATHTHRIGVIATAGTVQSGQYSAIIQRLDPQATVQSLATPDFVTMVEQQAEISADAQERVTTILAPLSQMNLDTLVLGCTHFPILSPLIQQAVGSGVRLVDPGEATIQVVHDLLVEKGLANTTGRDKRPNAYYTTGDAQVFDQLANAWLTDTTVHATHVPVSILSDSQSANEEAPQ